MSQEVILEKIAGIETLINTKFEFTNKEIGEVKKHVKITNGRVTKLELWKAGLIASWTIVTILFPILFVYFMNNLKYEINDKIVTEIELNNNKYFEIDD